MFKLTQKCNFLGGWKKHNERKKYKGKNIKDNNKSCFHFPIQTFENKKQGVNFVIKSESRK